MYIRLFKDESSTPEEINQTLTNYHKLISYYESLSGPEASNILEEIYGDINIYLDEISHFNPFITDRRFLEIRDYYFGILYNLGRLKNMYKLSGTFRNIPINC